MTDRELLELIYQDTQELKVKVNDLDHRMASLETKFEKLEAKVTELDNRMASL